MLYSYKECKKQYQTDYEIRKAIAGGELKRIGRGLYSDSDHDNELAIISKAYPYAVFTMNSAFYYQGLTDTIPRKYYFMTDKNATKIKDSRVVQIFDNNNSLTFGVEEKEYNGVLIRVFSMERLLVELIRNKYKLPFDYYKEIIGNYRKMIYHMDIQAVQEYAMQLPKAKSVTETLQMEVF